MKDHEIPQPLLPDMTIEHPRGQKLQRELTYSHGTGRFLYVTNVESSASFDIGK